MGKKKPAGKKKKKKTKEKKKKAKKDPQKSVEEERRIQLLTLAKSLKKKIKTETNDFNRFQTQRDQLNYFWVDRRTHEQIFESCQCGRDQFSSHNRCHGTQE